MVQKLRWRCTTFWTIGRLIFRAHASVTTALVRVGRFEEAARALTDEFRTYAEQSQIDPVLLCGWGYISRVSPSVMGLEWFSVVYKKMPFVWEPNNGPPGILCWKTPSRLAPVTGELLKVRDQMLEFLPLLLSDSSIGPGEGEAGV